MSQHSWHLFFFLLKKQVTVYAIGVGNSVSQASLNKIASLHCSYLVKDFESAFKVMQLGILLLNLFFYLLVFVFDRIR
jgi:hypothetical protein